MNLSREEVESIAEKAATKAVHHVLTELGIELHEPLEMQADFLHLRRLRGMTESIARKFIMTTFGLIAIGGLALILLAIKGRL